MEFNRVEYTNGELKKRVGRPSKFNTRLAEKIYFFAEKGLTDSEICYVLDIAESTFNLWKRSRSFSESLARAKEKPDSKLVSALYRRAMGMTVRRVSEIRDEQGQLIRKIERVKEIPPNPSAIIFWLINRQPGRWHLPTVPAGRKDKRPTPQEILEQDPAQLTDEQREWNALIKRMQAEMEMNRQANLNKQNNRRLP